MSSYLNNNYNSPDIKDIKQSLEFIDLVLFTSALPARPLMAARWLSCREGLILYWAENKIRDNGQY